MCEIDLDPCEVWIERHPRANKEHRCACCERVIRPGEVYLASFSVFDGHATTEKCCAACEADRNEFGDAHDAIPSPGYFRTLLEECIAEEDEARWKPMLRAIKARKAA